MPGPPGPPASQPCMAGRETQTNRETDKQTHRQTDRQEDRHTPIDRDIQTDRQGSFSGDPKDRPWPREVLAKVKKVKKSEKS